MKIVPCPIPQVTIDDEKSCDYEEVPTLTATTGDWTERDGGKSWFRFYASADATQPEGKSQEGTYKPNKGEGVYKYYVSEFNTEPLQLLTNPEGCEGPKKEVKLGIKLNYLRHETDWETRTEVSNKYREVTVDEILRRFMSL